MSIARSNPVACLVRARRVAPVRGLVAALVVAATGCGAPTEAPPCAPELPAVVAARAGGRVDLPHGGDVVDVRAADASLVVDATEDAVVLRAPLQAGAHDAVVACADGERALVVDVAPLAFAAVLDWEADEPAGVPGGREYFAWWLTPRDDERALYLYGGFAYEPVQFTPRNDLYRFDLETSSWSSVALAGPRPGPGGRVATSPTGDVRYFGGGDVQPDGSLATEPTFAAWTTTDDGGAAFAPGPTAGAPGSYTGSLFYDERRGRWLSVCGADANALGVHCEVHATDGDGAWTSIAVEGDVPPGRFGFHFAYDPEGDRVIVYGGQGESGVVDDTWALDLASDPPAWRPLADGLPRRNGAYAYDPIGRRLIVWGGTGDGRASLPGLDVLSLDDGGEAWSHVDVDGPAPRASGQCLYDDVEARLLCGFGNDDAVYTDLWALPL